MPLSPSATFRQQRVAFPRIFRTRRRFTTARDAFLASVLIALLHAPEYGAFSFEFFVVIALPVTAIGAASDFWRHCVAFNRPNPRPPAGPAINT